MELGVKPAGNVPCHVAFRDAAVLEDLLPANQLEELHPTVAPLCFDGLRVHFEHLGKNKILFSAGSASCAKGLR